ncbi:MAG: bifunctional metallophosphatase/5'-nucleotidase [Bryobacteraceae bacterium]|nr:bifunctional metallophosphatase/5'-nucleotidase [Bryobacteraceae bacterium]
MTIFNLCRLAQPVVVTILLFGCGARARPAERNLTILHINDLHARFLPDEQGRGGFAYVASAIRKEKETAGATLTLNGGDLVQGTPVSSIFRGLPCYEVANHLGFDVGVLGNHEFDYGWRRAREFVKAAHYPVIAANVVNDKGELLSGRAYAIHKAGGLRVAVIGALTETLPRLTREDARGPWKAAPVVEAVRRYASKLRTQSDLIVVLGHLGHEEDERILRQAPDVSVVVSGHDHAGQKEVREIDGRLAVKVRSYGVELGRLSLTVDTEKKRIVQYQWRRVPIDTTRRYPADRKVEALVHKWESKVAAVVDRPIGVAARRFDRRETKALLERAMAEVSGADVAYMNPGGVRDGLPQGQLLARHVWNVMPFDNLIVYERVKGKQIPKEAAAGRQLDPEREYVFATNDFIADQWKDSGPRFSQQGALVRDALIEWIKKRGTLE